MGGGHFDYDQFRMLEIADEIDRLIIKNGKEDEQDIWSVTYSAATMERFKEALQAVKIAMCYVHRIDWLVSGDDGEQRFHDRLEEELKELVQ